MHSFFAAIEALLTQLYILAENLLGITVLVASEARERAVRNLTRFLVIAMFLITVSLVAKYYLPSFGMVLGILFALAVSLVGAVLLLDPLYPTTFGIAGGLFGKLSGTTFRAGADMALKLYAKIAGVVLGLVSLVLLMIAVLPVQYFPMAFALFIVALFTLGWLALASESSGMFALFLKACKWVTFVILFISIMLMIPGVHDGVLLDRLGVNTNAVTINKVDKLHKEIKDTQTQQQIDDEAAALSLILQKIEQRKPLTSDEAQFLRKSRENGNVKNRLGKLIEPSSTGEIPWMNIAIIAVVIFAGYWFLRSKFALVLGGASTTASTSAATSSDKAREGLHDSIPLILVAAAVAAYCAMQFPPIYTIGVGIAVAALTHLKKTGIAVAVVAALTPLYFTHNPYSLWDDITSDPGKWMIAGVPAKGLVLGEKEFRSYESRISKLTQSSVLSAKFDVGMTFDLCPTGKTCTATYVDKHRGRSVYNVALQIPVGIIEGGQTIQKTVSAQGGTCKTESDGSKICGTLISDGSAVNTAIWSLAINNAYEPKGTYKVLVKPDGCVDVTLYFNKNDFRKEDELLKLQLAPKGQMC